DVDPLRGEGRDKLAVNGGMTERRQRALQCGVVLVDLLGGVQPAIHDHIGRQRIAGQYQVLAAVVGLAANALAVDLRGDVDLYLASIPAVDLQIYLVHDLPSLAQGPRPSARIFRSAALARSTI